MDNTSNNNQEPIYPTPTVGTASDTKPPEVKVDAPVQPAQPQLQPIQQPAIQAPVVSSQSQDQQQAHHDNPGTIILQWLTYAFWGWTVLSMSFLLVLVLNNLIAQYDDTSIMPYSIAATLVLLPISFVCDFLYSKKEPEKKTGASSIVMVIHAVLFALITIGSLIAIVFSIVELFIGSTNKIMYVALYSEMIITVLYAAVLLRVLNFPKLGWYRKFFLIFMVVVVGIFSVLAIVGPLANQRATKTDRLIDDNLSTVQQAVNDYYTQNSQLPTSLSQITVTGDAQSIINQKLVTYVPNSKTNSANTYGSTNISAATTNSPTAYYQLCVTYKKASPNNSYSSSPSGSKSAYYSTYISTYSHPAGYYCYNAETTNY